MGEINRYRMEIRCEEIFELLPERPLVLAGVGGITNNHLANLLVFEVCPD